MTTVREPVSGRGGHPEGSPASRLVTVLVSGLTHQIRLMGVFRKSAA
jgi:hypothetical protein